MGILYTLKVTSGRLEYCRLMISSYSVTAIKRLSAHFSLITFFVTGSISGVL